MQVNTNKNEATGTYSVTTTNNVVIHPITLIQQREA